MTRRIIRNIITLLAFILLLSTTTMLSSCQLRTCPAERGVRNLLRQIERGNLNDITLIIYGSGGYLSPFPWDVNTFIHNTYNSRIVIDGTQLEEHIDLFMRLSDIEFIDDPNSDGMNPRLYYVFKNSRGNTILDVVVFWGGMRVNGIDVEENPILREIIKPFLP